MKTKLLSLLVLLMIGCANPPKEDNHDAVDQRLLGSWNWSKTFYSNKDTSFTWTNINGRMIFTEKDYSLILIDQQGAREPLKGGWKNNSKEVLQKALQSFRANAGTYQQKGDSLFLFREIAMWPNAMLKDNQLGWYTISWSADTLILRNENKREYSVDHWVKRN